MEIYEKDIETQKTKAAKRVQNLRATFLKQQDKIKQGCKKLREVISYHQALPLLLFTKTKLIHIFQSKKLNERESLRKKMFTKFLDSAESIIGQFQGVENEVKKVPKIKGT